MPGRSLILIGLLAAACAGCASPRPAPEPGPVYAKAGVRERRIDPETSPRSIAGANWLQTRRRVELGEVPYNGLALPLFSPDARHIATQIGPAPNWAAVLGERVAAAPAGVIAVHQINAESPEPLSPPRFLPPGTLLGRAANADGFLVESPAHDDLPRRIGLADWRSDHIEWLTSGDADAAFAALAPDGSLAYSSRDPGSETWALALRTPGGDLHVISLAGESLVFPVIAASRGELLIFAIIVPHRPGMPMSIAAFRPAPSASSASASLAEVARVPLAAAGLIADAYQCVAGVPAFVDAGRSPAHMLAFSNSTNSIQLAMLAEQSPRTITLGPLVPGTFAAVSGRIGGRGCILACTVADTIYWDLEAIAGTNRQLSPAPVLPAPALVWPVPGVPRWLGGQKWPLAMLFMQTSSEGSAFRVVLIADEAEWIRK